MPKSTKTPAKPASRAAARSAARNTDSGPGAVSAALFDAPSQRAAQAQDLGDDPEVVGLAAAFAATNPQLKHPRPQIPTA